MFIAMVKFFGSIDFNIYVYEYINYAKNEQTTEPKKGQFAEIAFNYGIICFAINQDIDLREISRLQVERLTS